MKWASRLVTLYGLVLGCMAVHQRWFAPEVAVGIVAVPARYAELQPGDTLQYCTFWYYTTGAPVLATDQVPGCRTRYAERQAVERVEMKRAQSRM